jgi:hypothetical protein
MIIFTQDQRARILEGGHFLFHLRQACPLMSFCLGTYVILTI